MAFPRIGTFVNLEKIVLNGKPFLSNQINNCDLDIK